MSYNPSTGGHAPGDLRDAFLSMIETYHRTRGLGPIPDASIRDEPVTAHDLCGKLWNCSDILPGGEAELLDIPAGSTYAQGARKLSGSLA